MKESNIGYFASNRAGGQGKDDIYKVEILNEIKPVKEPLYSLKGEAVNELSHVPIDLEYIDTKEKIETLVNKPSYERDKSCADIS